MSDALQRRGGSTASHASFHGLLREITIDTDKHTVVVHDGATTGGFPLATEHNKDASGGYAGLTLFNLNLKNNSGTITSFLSNSATAIRNWTLPDADGQLALRSNTKIQSMTILSAGSGTYTTPAGVTGLKVRMVGGGGGGGGAGNAGTPTNGGTGGTTTFGTLSAAGGIGGSNSLTGGFLGGLGGTASGGLLNIAGASAANQIGNSVPAIYQAYGSNGANSILGSGGRGSINGGLVAGEGALGPGAGGGGAGGNSTTYASTGGGAGAYCETIIAAPLASYAYVIGAAGTPGSSGTGGGAGGAGYAGLIIIEEYYG